MSTTQLLFLNNAVATTALAITASDVSVGLTTGQGAYFPTPGAGQAFYVTISDGTNTEYVLCTDNTGDVLTITRAQDNSTAYAFAAGSIVEMRNNAATLGNFVQSYQLASYLPITSFNTSIASYAPLASPALTGTPTVPTAAAGTSNTQAASTAYADTSSADAASSAVSALGVPTPSAGVGNYFLTVNASGSTYVNISPSAVLTAIGAQAAGSYALSGVNSDITEITGLSVALSSSQGGTGLTTIGSAGQVIGTSDGTTISWVTAGPGAAIDNSAASSDITLNVGQAAYLDITTAVSSVPLHVATGDNETYRVDLFLTTNSTTAILYLQPNNTTYSNAIYRGYVQVAGTTVSGTSEATESEFGGLSVNTKPFCASFELSTKTTVKTAKALFLGPAANGYFYAFQELWNDTTTAWSSLGTLALNAGTFTGGILVTRMS